MIVAKRYSSIIYKNYYNLMIPLIMNLLLFSVATYTYSVVAKSFTQEV